MFWDRLVSFVVIGLRMQSDWLAYEYATCRDIYVGMTCGNLDKRSFLITFHPYIPNFLKCTCPHSFPMVFFTAFVTLYSMLSVRMVSIFRFSCWSEKFCYFAHWLYSLFVVDLFVHVCLFVLSFCLLSQWPSNCTQPLTVKGLLAYAFSSLFVFHLSLSLSCEL